MVPYSIYAREHIAAGMQGQEDTDKMIVTTRNPNNLKNLGGREVEGLLSMSTVDMGM